jgi:hypothetical protein
MSNNLELTSDSPRGTALIEIPLGAANGEPDVV